jgi:hypothetical protein
MPSKLKEAVAATLIGVKLAACGTLPPQHRFGAGPAIATPYSVPSPTPLPPSPFADASSCRSRSTTSFVDSPFMTYDQYRQDSIAYDSVSKAVVAIARERKNERTKKEVDQAIHNVLSLPLDDSDPRWTSENLTIANAIVWSSQERLRMLVDKIYSFKDPDDALSCAYSFRKECFKRLGPPPPTPPDAEGMPMSLYIRHVEP